MVMYGELKQEKAKFFVVKYHSQRQSTYGSTYDNGRLAPFIQRTKTWSSRLITQLL
ncbi:hypothetical protein M7I_5361 [Glarea lozoyensis 74030]|uniref:Uncharacterized protein n=1 Tax=Glarea lozoyensis (strain ATCC 74030 / MF5533) TaxID=1104152 RepID=H0ERP0_GLAL7|nr:hypothetical protein M7I_5361 [Glarea lozoyensis 74030]